MASAISTFPSPQPSMMMRIADFLAIFNENVVVMASKLALMGCFMLF
jgi:hypothetical protein